MGIEALAILVILIMSIVLHEMAHGYAANWLGDPTARLAGRLSSNPLVHIDLLGSVIVPALLFISNAGFIFGWAKPVPYNPYNLNNQKWGEAMVAAAGPATNIILAIVFAFIIRLEALLGLPASFIDLAVYAVFINILLAFFNMIPVPPLDGSKILMAVLPYQLAMRYRNLTMAIERMGIFVLFVILFILVQFIWPHLFLFVIKAGGLLTGLGASGFYNLL